MVGPYLAVRQSLGLFMGGLAAVGSIVAGLVLGPPAWPLLASALGLAVWALWRSLPRPHRYWQWLALVPGCALGMVVGLVLALSVSSQDRLQLVVEAAGFEATVLTLLDTADCQVVSSVLDTDLALLSQRPALAGQVRWEMWDVAAKHGCVSGPSLSQARARVLAHARAAPLSHGVSRADVLNRLEILQSTTPP